MDNGPEVYIANVNPEHVLNLVGGRVTIESATKF
jgi:phosphosulfolactate synthase (CoM biosynthesis protein A)